MPGREPSGGDAIWSETHASDLEIGARATQLTIRF